MGTGNGEIVRVASKRWWNCGTREAFLVDDHRTQRSGRSSEDACVEEVSRRSGSAPANLRNRSSTLRCAAGDNPLIRLKKTAPPLPLCERLNSATCNNSGAIRFRPLRPRARRIRRELIPTARGPQPHPTAEDRRMNQFDQRLLARASSPPTRIQGPARKGERHTN
jgi:hypothetical protein